ncbi:hypothetical protein [Sneathiella aquimaris]|uniref:hypothetical protein n=1 Tax=Sneathiella aquimaris TaxID=2599305 RepID=UPI00146F52ED|nr:hypothetical protein [Sneathiella aquimaris]
MDRNSYPARPSASFFPERKLIGWREDGEKPAVKKAPETASSSIIRRFTRIFTPKAPVLSKQECATGRC